MGLDGVLIVGFDVEGVKHVGGIDRQMSGLSGWMGGG